MDLNASSGFASSFDHAFEIFLIRLQQSASSSGFFQPETAALAS